MLNDFYTHWKYIVGFLFYSILLVLPIYININKLSSITITPTQIAYFFYMLNILWNGYFLYNNVSIYFFIFYIILIIVFGIMNPFKLLTNFTPMIYTFFITLFMMILLKLFKLKIFTTLFIFMLTILSQMALYSFSEQPTFWLLGIILIYLIGYNIYSVNISIGIPTIPPYVIRFFVSIYTFIKSFILSIYNMNTIEKTGIFLLITGSILYLYIRTVAKSYYGGQILVNDPISLEENNTFTISPTYHSSLSCWVYLTPTTKTEANTIFLYGEQLLVSYEADVNSLRVRLKDDISYIERKPMLQKWNHIAFVYDHGRIVLFLNGEVIHSSEWSPPSFTNEILFGRIKGKICHVRYYNNALDERFIKSLYEDFKQKNPPIV